MPERASTRTPNERRPRWKMRPCLVFLALRWIPPILRVVVHLELPIDLRHHAISRHVGDEPGDFSGKVIALLPHHSNSLVAARTKFRAYVVAFCLLAHVKDLELDNRHLVDDRA